MKSDLNSQFGRDSYEEYSHAEVDNAKRGLPLTVANYKLRLGILNKLEYEHVAKEFRDCFVLCPKLVPMPEQVMGFKYQISVREECVQMKSVWLYQIFWFLEATVGTLYRTRQGRSWSTCQHCVPQRGYQGIIRNCGRCGCSKCDNLYGKRV